MSERKSYSVFRYTAEDKDESFLADVDTLEEAIQLAESEQAVSPDRSCMITHADSAKMIKWPGLRGRSAHYGLLEEMAELNIAYTDSLRKLIKSQLADDQSLWSFAGYLGEKQNGSYGRWMQELRDHVLAEIGFRAAVVEMQEYGYDQIDGDVGWKNEKAYRKGVELTPDDPYFDRWLGDDHDEPETDQ